MVVGGCAINPVLIGGAVIVGLVSAILFLIWTEQCNRERSFCDTVARLIQVFRAIVVAVPIVGGFVAIFGGLPCGLGVLAADAYYGPILVVLEAIYERRCED